jgi:hypothetical protein
MLVTNKRIFFVDRFSLLLKERKREKEGRKEGEARGDCPEFTGARKRRVPRGIDPFDGSDYRQGSTID